MYVFFRPRRKNFIQNNPSRRSGHWLGPIHSVELAGVEGLKTACVLGACQFCDSWHGRGWVGRASLSPPNVSCLRSRSHYPLLREGGLWKHTQSLPCSVSSPLSYLCLLADAYACGCTGCILSSICHVWVWWESLLLMRDCSVVSHLENSLLSFLFNAGSDVGI